VERLRQSDLKSLLAFASECYSGPVTEPFDGFIPRISAACLRLIPCAHTIGYAEMNPETTESRNYFNVAGLATPHWDRLWEHHMHEHPVLTHLVQTEDRHARRISDFLSQRRFRDTGLHHEIYRLWDIDDVLCVAIPCEPPWIAGVAWHSERAFTDRERLIADLVRPHIGQAWSNTRVAIRLQSQLQALEAGIESLGTGIIVCSGQGSVQFINAQARLHLAEYFGATRQTDQRLPSDLLLWMRHEDSRLNENSDAPPVRMPLVCERGNKRLTVRLLSQTGANLILMEEQPTAPGSARFESLGLTARESEVLSWIARGKTNGEIATILGAQTGTVKKHVEHIFEKLGVETRTAAATVALANGHAKPDS
jgi:DNA-binding CsgD family transcriptional regulator